MDLKKITEMMSDTKSAHRALAESFERDKEERIRNFRDWIHGTKERLAEYRRQIEVLPGQISQMEEELAVIERLEMVPLEEMVREVKP